MEMNNYRPWITPKSIEYIDRWIQSVKNGGGTVCMCEYGSGGSTIYFSNYVDSIISFETDKKYYDEITDILKKNNTYNKINYKYIKLDHVYLKSYLETPKQNIQNEKIREFTDIMKINNDINIVFLDGCCRIELIAPIVEYLKNKQNFLFIIDNVEKPKIAKELNRCVPNDWKKIDFRVDDPKMLPWKDLNAVLKYHKLEWITTIYTK